MIENAAARLLTHTERSDLITSILAALHWLPVSLRIALKAGSEGVVCIVELCASAQCLSVLTQL